jgi:MFS family permease
MPVLFLGVLTVALDIALVATSLPAMRQAFQLDERSASWILGTFVLFTLIGLPVMTTMSDRFGRRVVYLADFGLFVAGSLVLITAEGFGQLLIGRALQGLGASGIFPVASAVIGDTVDPAKRGRALGILGSVYGLAFMIGPILGGVLVQYGWQWPFIANLGLATIVIIISALNITDRVHPSPGRVDWSGLVVLAILLAALSIGMNQLDTQNLVDSLLSLHVWPLLLLSLILIPVFARIERARELEGRQPVLRMGLVRKRQVALVGLFAAAHALGLTSRNASFMLLPLVTAVSIASPIAGRVLDSVGSKRIIVAGLLFIAGGMAVLGWSQASVMSFVAGSVAIGIGLACLLGSALSYILLAEAEVTERTVAQGINTLFISIGQLLGSAVIGAIAASAPAPAEGYQSAFRWIAVLSLFLLAASIFLSGYIAEKERLAR